MRRKELHETRELSDNNTIYEWLSKNGVKILESIGGTEASNSEWLLEVGILNNRERHITTNTVTHIFLGNNRDYSDGWYRGGAESFYKIVEIIYSSNAQMKRKFVAFKAIHSLGDINRKMLTEATWMTQISQFDRCGYVYAIGAGTIVKEFLEEDEPNQLMTASEHIAEKNEILQLLYSHGLQPSAGTKVETIQHNNRLILIDLGAGDISGPDAHTFIKSLPKLG